MSYGHFSPDGMEYVITRYDPPRPWANMLTNGRYCALVSQTGGGYSFVESSGYNRLLRAYPPEMVLADRPGRYVYVRDNDTGIYWSLNWQPVQRTPAFWECRHGLGYTIVRSVNEDIAGEITYFVPLDADVEVWLVRLQNRSGRPRRLGLFTYVEWCLGNYGFDLLETSFADLFNVVEYRDGVIHATKRLWNVGHRPAKPHALWGRHTFLAAGFPVQGYDCRREAFLGMFGSLARPQAVERGNCSDSAGTGRDAVGVLHSRGELHPGQEYVFTVTLGVAAGADGIAPLVNRFRDPAAAEAELERVRAYWREYLGNVKVNTPDPDFDLAVNIWNPYQAWFTSHWARMASYYVGGGSIIGFRDILQDLLGILPTEPGRAKRRLLEIMRHQFADGGTLHNWDPISDTGPRTGHSDDPLWLVLAIVEYVKETGELGFLDHTAAYYDGGQGTVWEHLTRAIEYTLSRRSERGIPLMGAADWNDGLDQVGDEGYGESVMVAEHLAWMLREVAPLAERRGEKEVAARYRSLYRDLARAINEHFWDGGWYRRATTDEGEWVGSSSNREGKIYLNAQSWAVLSGIAPPERAVACMDAVKKYLDTPYGPCIFLPAYTEPDEKIGIITHFVPGTKENGTVFNHPVTWAVIAEAMLGRGDQAYEYYRKTSFVVRGREPEVYRADPYVYAEYVYGPDSPYFGQGEFTWTTGTAPWMWRACLDWILGIRPDLDGLRVDPCIPRHWPGYRISRRFRGAMYHFEVQNPRGVNRGVTRVTVDGSLLDGNLVPACADGGEHHVVAVLG